MKRILLLTLCFFLFIGCNEKKTDIVKQKSEKKKSSITNFFKKEIKIDTSSTDTMAQTVKEMRESIPEDKREEFDKALMEVSFKNVNIFNDTKDLILSKNKVNLHNKTYNDIISEYELIKKENETKQKESLKKDIENLKIDIQDLTKKKNEFLKETEKVNNKIKKAEENKTKTKLFVIENITFKWIENGNKYFKNLIPVMDINVVNKTQQPISRVYIKASVKTLGRSIPWVSDIFNYEINGGLEPGEKAHWILSLNEYTDWGNVPKEEKNLIVEAEVYKLEGAKGEVLWDTTISDYDYKKISNYREKINYIDKRIIEINNDIDEKEDEINNS
mgnify:CR=1 FL=1